MQIDIDHHERFRGESNYTLIKSISVWLKLMTSFSIFPLRIATFIGIFASIFGFLLAMYYLTRYLFIGSTVEGWTSLMIMLLLLCGTILLALGAIGEYVGRSYIQLYKKFRLLGSAALSLAYVACSRCDAYFEEDIMFWDVAAGIALVKAAGGQVHYQNNRNKKWALTVRAGAGCKNMGEGL